MERFPTPMLSELPGPQRAVYERIVEGRGKLPRPYWTLLASPDVTELMGKLSQQLWKGALPRAVLEAVFLSVARVQHCQYQWDNHLTKAMDAGITQESLEVMRDGRIPVQSESLAAALTFVDEMQRMKRAQDSTFAAVISHFGEQGMAELCAFLGFATTISFLLNAQQNEVGVATTVSS